MKVIVPDASVLLKWVLAGPDEQDLEPALRLREAALRGSIGLKVPSLWVYEVGNVLTRRFPRRARALLDALIAFELDEGAGSDEWLDQAVSLTRTYGVTFYDAAYHALAVVERGIFVTADIKYVRMAEQAGAVVPLQDWS